MSDAIPFRPPFGLRLPSEPFRLDLRLPRWPHELAIDLYDATNPVHPEGHVCWWTFDTEGRDAVTVTIDPARGDRIAIIEDAPAMSGWHNPDVDLDAIAVFQMQAVLRVVRDPEPRWRTTTFWVRDRAYAEAARRRLEPTPWVRELAAPEIPLAPGARIHVAAADVREGDAIGNLALDTVRALRLHGHDARPWARWIGEGLRGEVGALDQLAEHARADDLVLYHYSTTDPELGRVLDSPATTVCYYHGVTPPRLAGDAAAREACERGLAELPTLARADGWIAATSFTAGELRAALGRDVPVDLVPPTLGLGRFAALAPEPVARPGSGRFLLYVGRFAPHKGLGLLVDAFAELAVDDPKCDLVLAGMPGGEDVAARRAALPSEVAARIHVVEGASDAQLATLYQACTAFVTASEHEGFCVPIAEAFAFGKPVFAFETPAVRETLGGAGCGFAEREPRALAALLRRVLGDPAEVARVTAGQQERFAELRRAADGHRLWEALARALRRAGASS